MTDAHGQRMAVYDQYTEAVNKFKASKDTAALTNARKKIDNDLKNVTTQIGDYQTDMKAGSSEVSDKVNEFWFFLLRRKWTDSREPTECFGD